jgi:hypothetical protein
MEYHHMAFRLFIKKCSILYYQYWLVCSFCWHTIEDRDTTL